MASVTYDELEKLSNDIQKIISEAPEKRRKLHEQIANLLETELNKNIDSSINDSNGNVKSMQEKKVGSGGGYAAVHPKKGNRGKLRYGELTSYLENGHAIRKPSSNSGRYRPRIKVSYVNGGHFYQKTASSIEAKVIALAEKFVDDIIRDLEG